MDDRTAHLEALLAAATIENAATRALVKAGCLFLKLGVPQVVPHLKLREDGTVVALDRQGHERFGFDGSALGADAVVRDLQDDDELAGLFPSKKR